MATTRLSVVADSTALIALDKIGLLDPLKGLFAELLIPPAVSREIAPTVQHPRWVQVRALTQPVDAQLVAASLGDGETEAIALAIELDGRTVLLDELAGRRAAGRLGLPVIGTLGLLIEAKRQGLVQRLDPVLQRLTSTGFYASPALINRVHVLAGEPPTS